MTYHSIDDLPNPPHPSVVNFLRAHADQPEACWPWTGCDPIWAGDNRTVRVRRLAWMTTVGPIPPEHVVVRTCPTPRCINPAHLYPSVLAGGHPRRLTCDQGHPLTQDQHGHRQCPTCRRQHGRAADVLVAHAHRVLGMTRPEYSARYRRSAAAAAAVLIEHGIDPLVVIREAGLDPDLVLDGSPALAALLDTGELRTYNLTNRPSTTMSL